MTYDEVLLETYIENIAELEDERAGLTYYKGFDGEIIEKYVTCKRPNCIYQRGYPHGPNKYFRHREGGRWVELYLGKKIVDEYVAKVESNKRIREIERELRVLRSQLTAVRRRLGLADENGACEQLRLDLNPDWILALAARVIFVRKTRRVASLPAEHLKFMKLHNHGDELPTPVNASGVRRDGESCEVHFRQQKCSGRWDEPSAHKTRVGEGTILLTKKKMF